MCRSGRVPHGIDVLGWNRRWSRLTWFVLWKGKYDCRRRRKEDEEKVLQCCSKKKMKRRKRPMAASLNWNVSAAVVVVVQHNWLGENGESGQSESHEPLVQLVNKFLLICPSFSKDLALVQHLFSEVYQVKLSFFNDSFRVIGIFALPLMDVVMIRLLVVVGQHFPSKHT